MVVVVRKLQNLALTLGLMISFGALAQDASTKFSNQQNRLKELLGARITGELGHYFSLAHFHFSLQLELVNVPESQTPLPYLPTSTAAPMGLIGDHLSNYELVSRTKSITMNIRMIEDYQDKTYEFIRELLREKFGIADPDSKRSDELSFGKLEIDTFKQENVLKDALADKDSKIAERDAKITQQSTELTRISQEAKKLEDDRQRLLEKLELVTEEKKEKVSKLSENLSLIQKKLAEATQLKEKGQAFFQEYESYIIGILVLITAILSTTILSSAIKSMGNYFAAAIDKVAKSLRRQVASDEGQSPTNIATAPTTTMPVPVAAGSADAGSTSGDHNWSLEAVENRLLTLQQDLLSLVDNEAESTLLNLFNLLLSQDKTELCVAGMELLGKDTANALYHLLSQNHKLKVFNFLQNGIYTKSKLLTMIDAGEIIKTRLIGTKILTGEKAYSSQVKAKLELLPASELPQLFAKLSLEQMVRTLSYFDENQILEILYKMKTSGFINFDVMIDAVVNLPKSGDFADLDRSIEQILESLDAGNEDSMYRSFQPFFKFIIENAEQSVSDMLTERLANVEVMKPYLVNEVVTLADFFTIDQDIQDDLLDHFNMSETAILIMSFDPELQASLTSRFNSEELEILTEEMEKAAATSEYKTRAKQKRLRVRLLTLLRDLTREIPLAELKAKSNDSNNNAAGRAQRTYPNAS